MLYAQSSDGLGLFSGHSLFLFLRDFFAGHRSAGSFAIAIAFLGLSPSDFFAVLSF
jgi:hypothetical protein